MKTYTIESSSSNLISETDIEFIKKHLRYPIRSISQLKPIVFSLIFLVLFVVIYLFNKFILDAEFNDILPSISIFVISLLFTIWRGFRFLRSLFFQKIKSNYSQIDNIGILTNFFVSKQFKYYTLNNITEVFIMQSNENRNNKEREVVVFIAMENEILINSHISTENFLPASQRKFDELKSMLEEYILKNNKQILVVT